MSLVQSLRAQRASRYFFQQRCTYMASVIVGRAGSCRSIWKAESTTHLKSALCMQPMQAQWRVYLHSHLPEMITNDGAHGVARRAIYWSPLLRFKIQSAIFSSYEDFLVIRRLHSAEAANLDAPTRDEIQTEEQDLSEIQYLWGTSTENNEPRGSELFLNKATGKIQNKTDLDNGNSTSSPSVEEAATKADTSRDSTETLVEGDKGILRVDTSDSAVDCTHKGDLVRAVTVETAADRVSSASEPATSLETVGLAFADEALRQKAGSAESESDAIDFRNNDAGWLREAVNAQVQTLEYLRSAVSSLATRFDELNVTNKLVQHDIATLKDENKRISAQLEDLHSSLLARGQGAFPAIESAPFLDRMKVVELANLVPEQVAEIAIDHGNEVRSVQVAGQSAPLCQGTQILEKIETTTVITDSITKFGGQKGVKKGVEVAVPVMKGAVKLQADAEHSAESHGEAVLREMLQAVSQVHSLDSVGNVVEPISGGVEAAILGESFQALEANNAQADSARYSVISGEEREFNQSLQIDSHSTNDAMLRANIDNGVKSVGEKVRKQVLQASPQVHGVDSVSKGGVEDVLQFVEKEERLEEISVARTYAAKSTGNTEVSDVKIDYADQVRVHSIESVPVVEQKELSLDVPQNEVAFGSTKTSDVKISDADGLVDNVGEVKEMPNATVHPIKEAAMKQFEERLKSIILEDGSESIRVENPQQSGGHPWPEWIAFLEHVRGLNFFKGEEARAKDETTLFDNPVSVKRAVYKFSSAHETVFESLSRKDLRIIGEYGCPSDDRRVVASGKRLRNHYQIEEKRVCDPCSLKNSCEAAYVKPANVSPKLTDITRLISKFAQNAAAEAAPKGSIPDNVKSAALHILQDIVAFSAKKYEEEGTKSENLGAIIGDTRPGKKGDQLSCSSKLEEGSMKAEPLGDANIVKARKKGDRHQIDSDKEVQVSRDAAAQSKVGEISAQRTEGMKLSELVEQHLDGFSPRSHSKEKRGDKVEGRGDDVEELVPREGRKARTQRNDERDERGHRSRKWDDDDDDDADDHQRSRSIKGGDKRFGKWGDEDTDNRRRPRSSRGNGINLGDLSDGEADDLQQVKATRGDNRRLGKWNNEDAGDDNRRSRSSGDYDRSMGNQSRGRDREYGSRDGWNGRGRGSNSYENDRYSRSQERGDRSFKDRPSKTGDWDTRENDRDRSQRGRGGGRRGGGRSGGRRF